VGPADAAAAALIATDPGPMCGHWRSLGSVGLSGRFKDRLQFREVLAVRSPNGGRHQRQQLRESGWLALVAKSSASIWPWSRPVLAANEQPPIADRPRRSARRRWCLLPRAPHIRRRQELMRSSRPLPSQPNRAITRAVSHRTERHDRTPPRRQLPPRHIGISLRVQQSARLHCSSSESVRDQSWRQSQQRQKGWPTGSR
jgi:hypothetical protein